MIAENKIQFKADVHRSQLKGSSTERFTNHVSKVRELQNGVNAESSSTVCCVSYSVDCVDRHKESLYEAQTGFRSEECVTNSSREIKESLHEAQTEVTSEECISKSINRIKESSDEAYTEIISEECIANSFNATKQSSHEALTEVITEECIANSSNATKESSHEALTEIISEECSGNSTNEIKESLHEAHTEKIISKECMTIASVPTDETKTVASAKPRGKKRNSFKKNKVDAACPQKVDGWNEVLQNIRQNNLILNADFIAVGTTMVDKKYPRFIG